MSTTTVANGNVVDRFSGKFFKEYIRSSGFDELMGTNENSAFQLVEDLMKQSGDQITVPLVTRLINAGITGDSTLEGNEEALGNYSHQITINAIANAVRITKMERIKTEIDLLEASREMLKWWEVDTLRSAIIAALQSPVVDGKTAYASATEGQKDTWVAAQYAANRVLFGAAKSNYSASDHSASLLNVDSTNDILQPNIVSLAKRTAKAADPHMRPIRVDGGGEWYILLAGSLPFRDLKTHATMTQANRDGWVRGKDNPLFKDGDLMWDGVIIKEIPEIGVISTVGAGTPAIDCAANFLVGAQALGIAWGQRPKFVTKKFDYERQMGVAVDEVRGIEKLTFNSVQHGVLTVYTAAVADT